MCGTGGCPWIILDTPTAPVKLIGEIGGKEIWINSKKRNGYHLIDSYWKQEANKVSYHKFTFIDGEYKLTKSREEIKRD